MKIAVAAVVVAAVADAVASAAAVVAEAVAAVAAVVAAVTVEIVAAAAAAVVVITVVVVAAETVPRAGNSQANIPSDSLHKALLANNTFARSILLEELDTKETFVWQKKI